VNVTDTVSPGSAIGVDARIAVSSGDEPASSQPRTINAAISGRGSVTCRMQDRKARKKMGFRPSIPKNPAYVSFFLTVVAPRFPQEKEPPTVGTFRSPGGAFPYTTTSYAAPSSFTYIVPCMVAQWPGKVHT